MYYSYLEKVYLKNLFWKNIWISQYHNEQVSFNTCRENSISLTIREYTLFLSSMNIFQKLVMYGIYIHRYIQTFCTFQNGGVISATFF